jgi:hypothetical protein
VLVWIWEMIFWLICLLLVLDYGYGCMQGTYVLVFMSASPLCFFPSVCSTSWVFWVLQYTTECCVAAHKPVWHQVMSYYPVCGLGSVVRVGGSTWLLCSHFPVAMWSQVLNHEAHVLEWVGKTVFASALIHLAFWIQSFAYFLGSVSQFSNA